MFEILFIIVMMLFLFGITIFVHEWGHFIVAKKCGLKIEAFSIGMGPALWKKEVDGIVYKIGALPMGGYVSLPQLDPAGMEKIQGDNEEEPRDTLPDISPWKKIAVAVAGPLCNIIFALVLAVLISVMPKNEVMEDTGVFIADVEADSKAYAAGLRSGDEILAVNGAEVSNWYETRVESLLSGGAEQIVDLTVANPADGERVLTIPVNHPEKSEQLIDGANEASPCQIFQVVEGSPAEKAGLLADDTIFQINDTLIKGTSHFIEIIQANPDTEVIMHLIRDGGRMELPIIPEYSEEHDQVMIGIQFGGSLGLPWTLQGNPFEQIYSDASSIFRLLKALVTPSESKQAASGLGGPVSIFQMIFISLQMSMLTTLGLIRFININLAVLNLLPLPVLDGGHICFALWEGTTKRKVHPKVVASLVNVFAILLLSAMAILTWRDTDRIWNVSRFFKGDDAEQTTEQPAEIPVDEAAAEQP
ncbi:RIP metalloprotease RseP [Pontiella sp.]|uniref:RIP metalloprotease RseP n=1 Tax=Pontiella sp. TaxID=2837462 RepID=UPI003563ADBD